MESPLSRRDSRFQHLLQPIRELADNWNVDIAAELEDYLEELASIKISLDGGHTSLNFAEAALLIQGSACIYSKKVEFLYSLVFHTLDMVTAQKRSAGAQKSSIGPSGEDADIAFQAEEFLELDDVLKEATNIDLVEDGGQSAWARRRMEAPRERLGALRLEQSLGEEAFRITSSAVAHDGTLMLDVGNGGLLGLSPIRASSPQRGIATPGFALNSMMDDSPGGGGGGDSPIDYGGMDDAGSSSPAVMNAPAAAARTKRGARTVVAPVLPSLPPPADPWAVLDPHAADANSSKPLVRARPPRPVANAAEIAREGRTAALKSNTSIGAASIEFDYIFKRERQRIAKKRFAAVRNRQSLGLPSAGIALDDDEDDADAGGFDDYGGDADGCDDYDGGHDVDVNAFMAAGHTETEFNAPASRGVRSSLDAVFQTTNSSLSYEDLCKKHIEAFMKGAEDFAVETQLTRRVAEWQDRMEPLLQQEERRPEFNIFVYGNTIIHKLEELTGQQPLPKSKKTGASALASTIHEDSTCEFRELANDFEPYDVCRTFLACLQLANDGNVDIVGSPADSCGLGTFGVKLLDAHRRVLNLA